MPFCGKRNICRHFHFMRNEESASHEKGKSEGRSYTERGKSGAFLGHVKYRSRLFFDPKMHAFVSWTAASEKNREKPPVLGGFWLLLFTFLIFFDNCCLHFCVLSIWQRGRYFSLPRRYAHTRVEFKGNGAGIKDGEWIDGKPSWIGFAMISRSLLQ